MKLLVDENLAPGLVHELGDLFPGSIHVRDIGLGNTPDQTIWDYAKSHGFTFVTKDKDFGNLSMARGAPPKVVLLQTGNCSTRMLEGLIRRNALRLAAFDEDERRGLLILR